MYEKLGTAKHLLLGEKRATNGILRPLYCKNQIKAKYYTLSILRRHIYT